MNRTAVRVVFQVVLALSLSPLAAGCAPSGPSISVSDAIVPVPANPDEAAVYLTIANRGGTDDRLVGAVSGDADMVHLHATSISDDGLASMSGQRRIEVGAGERVRLSPGSLHLMLMRPRALEVGDTVELTLIFERSGDVAVTALVTADATAAFED